MISNGEMVQKIAAATGKSYQFVDVPEAAAKDGMLKSGMHPVLVDALLEFMRNVKAGKAAVVSNDVEKVLGRKARNYDAWLKENLKAFA